MGQTKIVNFAPFWLERLENFVPVSKLEQIAPYSILGQLLNHSCPFFDHYNQFQQILRKFWPRHNSFLISQNQMFTDHFETSFFMRGSKASNSKENSCIKKKLRRECRWRGN